MPIFYTSQYPPVQSFFRRLSKWCYDWKPIHLCWYFNKMGFKIPKYLIGADDWQSPTGHFDHGGWSDEFKAYDDNTTTRASTLFSPGWSNFLDLTINELNCDKLRFWAIWQSGFIEQIDLDVYYTGGWHDVYEGAFANLEWVEKSLLGTYAVTSARVRFYNGSGSSINARLYEFDFNQIEVPPPSKDASRTGIYTFKTLKI